MKKQILLCAIVTLMPSLALSADNVVVIPLGSSSSDSSLNFDVTADGTTFTSKSKGWTLVGYDLYNRATFFSDKGYLFSVDNSVESRMLKSLTIMYLGANCTGPAVVGWNDGGFIPGEVFRNGTDLFYTKPTDTNLGAIAYLSYRSDGTCSNSSSTSWAHTYYAYANDANVTGVNFTNPKSIVLSYSSAQ